MMSQIFQIILVLSVLGSDVVVMSDQVNFTVTLLPGNALQDYLCNASLKSNRSTTVVLDDGEHRISSGPLCDIFNEGNMKITGSSMKNTTVRCEGEGRVFRFSSIQELIIERMKFINCRIHVVSIKTTLFTNCIFQNSSNGTIFSESSNSTYITSCVFYNNSAPGGGGGSVELYGSTGNVSITNCTFQNNSATYGGAMMLYVSTGNVIITNCAFQNNNVPGGGYGGAVRLYRSTGNVSITNCIFQNNSATDGGGGAVKLDVSTGNVSITNCTFQNNSVTGGGYGGAVEFYALTGNIRITHCVFQNNSAFQGGAIAISSVSLTMISNSTFTNNYGAIGAAVFADSLSDEKLMHILLQEVVVKGNHCSRGGAIYFDGVHVDIFGNTTTGSQFSSNSPKGAIEGQNGQLRLHGNVTFTENIGVTGGAISLFNYVLLYFHEGCRVEFSKNLATGFGGAIYSNGIRKNIEFLQCIIGVLDQYGRPVELTKNYSFSITFRDNHSQLGGHAVYATPIYNCRICFNEYCGDSGQLTSYFTITPLPGDINDTQILSFPIHVNLCGCSYPKLCNVTSQYQGKVTTYPGGTVRLHVTAVDDANNLSPSVIYTQIDTSGTTSLNISLVSRQKAQWISTVCDTIEYQIYGPEMASFKLFLTNNLDNLLAAVIEVNLLPCEPGFTLMSNSSTGIIMCDCSQFFTSHGVVCDASDGTVTRNKTNWIGVYNDTIPALASTCPLDYCNSTINKLSLGRPGDLCNGGRTGIICGHCHGSHSVIFGSSKCQVCSDMWLVTLVMFAVLGVLIVAALFFLNLTVTQGTLYGLIFYANIVQVNSSIFFSQSILNPMKVIVSFVNLDLGLPLCFYDGMDDADKAGLQFVFPAYLLILTMTVIVFCHYCLQRYPTTSTSSCLYRLPIIIGERAVGVLSTLIYLSYSKLLRTVIDIFTYSTVHLPSGDIYVWFYDGNMEYLHGKHTVLFVVAMVTSALFLLPYTFALTFIPIIERHSEHNRLFNYLHKKVNQMKPMNDAHYAPYKGKWRWWLGARLWLLVVMYSLNPVYSSDKPSLLLSIQATMVILFMLVQAGIKPFGQVHEQTDKHTSYTIFYNRLYNCLDLFYLLNYTALALSMSYILDQSSDQTQMTVVSVGVLVGLFVMMVMLTVLYHLIVVILKACNMYDRAREKIKGLFERKYKSMVPVKLDEPTNNTVSTTIVTVNYGLREPLCED